MQLNPGRYRYMTLSTDKLVPVCPVDSREQARYDLQEKGQVVPLITYRGGLAMGRIVGDRLETSSYALTPFVRCDSLDVAHGAVAKVLRVAWLPWSLVAADCRRGALAALGGVMKRLCSRCACTVPVRVLPILRKKFGKPRKQGVRTRHIFEPGTPYLDAQGITMVH